MGRAPTTIQRFDPEDTGAKPQSDPLAAEVSAGFIEFKPRSIKRWRTQRPGPRFIKEGRPLYYQLADLAGCFTAETRQHRLQDRPHSV